MSQSWVCIKSENGVCVASHHFTETIRNSNSTRYWWSSDQWKEIIMGWPTASYPIINKVKHVAFNLLCLQICWFPRCECWIKTFHSVVAAEEAKHSSRNNLTNGDDNSGQLAHKIIADRDILISGNHFLSSWTLKTEELNMNSDCVWITWDKAQANI